MAFTTKALSFFYKRLGPTGSVPGSWVEGYLPALWWDSSSTSAYNSVYYSFLNYPTDGNYTYVNTRDSASNATFRAVPWGSHACDFLWNVQVPLRNYSNNIQNNLLAGLSYTPQYTWSRFETQTITPTANSFHHAHYPGGTSFGVASYSVTSSWQMVDPKLMEFSYVTGEGNTQSVANLAGYFVGSQPSKQGISPSPSTQLDQSSAYAYDISYPSMSSNAISAVDNQYFDVGTGAGITSTDVVSNWSDVISNYNDNTPTGLNDTTVALKSLRLFFPTPVSGSGTTGGTDYWFKYFTGYTASEIFTENGGIYNVQFTLKSYPSNYSPASGDRLRIFIHNVIPQVPSSSARIPGADGWYPPENNIVSIGNGWNGTPILSFNDPQTGYKVEKFNFNLVQYGYPAQFCIEPSGSFGCIVSDIEICKIGVTTDPNFIKPTTVTQNIINQLTIPIEVSNPYQPPAP